MVDIAGLLPEREWRYEGEDGHEGPVSTSVLGALADAGKITEHTMVCRVGHDEWHAARDTELILFFRSTPDPPPELTSLKRLRNYMPLTTLSATYISLTAGFLILAPISEAIDTADSLTNASPRLNQWAMFVFTIMMALLFFKFIFFLMWSWRGYENLPILGARGLRFEPGMVAWWWFVPLANMVMPYRILQDLWRGSSNPLDWETQEPSRLMRWWWCLLWVGIFADLALIVSFFIPSLLSSRESVEMLMQVHGVARLVLLGIATVMHIMWAMLVYRMTQMQHAAYRQLARTAR